MPYDYPAKSLDIQTRLRMLGLWTLSERNIEGVRPFTETMNAEAQFNMLGAGSLRLSDKSNSVLRVAARAAVDLNEYRNSLVHGYLLSFGANSVPSFMKNPHWHGATGRKKAVGDAYIDEPIQDLVLVAAWNLFALVGNVEKVFSDPDAQRAIEAMKDDVDRARSYAGEARHLRSLMNEEKY